MPVLHNCCNATQLSRTIITLSQPRQAGIGRRLEGSGVAPAEAPLTLSVHRAYPRLLFCVRGWIASNRKVAVKASPTEEREHIIHTDKPTSAPGAVPEPETNNGHEPRDESNEEWDEPTNHRDSWFECNQRQFKTQEHPPQHSWDNGHSNREGKHDFLSKSVFPPRVNRHLIAHSHRPT